MKLIKKYPNGDNVIIEVTEDIGNNLLENYPNKFEIYNETNIEENKEDTPKKKGRKPVKNEDEGNSIESQD